MEKKQWYTRDVHEILTDLKSNENGITSAEAEAKIKQYGYNELVEKKRITPLQILLNQFKDIFVIMLLVAIVVSVAIGWYKSGGEESMNEYIDAITIGLIVVLNAAVGFVQEYRSEKAIEAMKKLQAPRAHVLRDGKPTVLGSEGSSPRRHPDPRSRRPHPSRRRADRVDRSDDGGGCPHG